MTTDWTEIETVAENGTPFVDENDFNGIVHNDWNICERIEAIEALYSGGGVPLGSVIMWYGTANTIPNGFVICDGTNGTPDLRNAFIYGASQDSDLTTIGGNPSHVHNGGTVDTQPDHTHSVTATMATAVSAYHYVSGSGTSTMNNHNHNLYTPSISAKGAHSHKLGITGSASNYPPYKIVYYITRLA